MAAGLNPGRPGSAGERLALADRLLREPELVERAVWPRACTWLIRLAVEHAIDDYWARHRPQMVAPNRRAQLIVLRHLRPDVGPAVAALWSRLSRVAHHHAYELAPTAGELRGWHTEAHRIVAALGGAVG